MLKSTLMFFSPQKIWSIPKKWTFHFCCKSPCCSERVDGWRLVEQRNGCTGQETDHGACSRGNVLTVMGPALLSEGIPSPFLLTFFQVYVQLSQCSCFYVSKIYFLCFRPVFFRPAALCNSKQEVCQTWLNRNNVADVQMCRCFGSKNPPAVLKRCSKPPRSRGARIRDQWLLCPADWASRRARRSPPSSSSQPRRWAPLFMIINVINQPPTPRKQV